MDVASHPCTTHSVHTEFQISLKPFNGDGIIFGKCFYTGYRRVIHHQRVLSTHTVLVKICVNILLPLIPGYPNRLRYWDIQNYSYPKLEEYKMLFRHTITTLKENMVSELIHHRSGILKMIKRQTIDVCMEFGLCDHVRLLLVSGWRDFYYTIFIGLYVYENCKFVVYLVLI